MKDEYNLLLFFLLIYLLNEFLLHELHYHYRNKEQQMQFTIGMKAGPFSTVHHQAVDHMLLVERELVTLTQLTQV